MSNILTICANCAQNINVIVIDEHIVFDHQVDWPQEAPYGFPSLERVESEGE